MLFTSHFFHPSCLESSGGNVKLGSFLFSGEEAVCCTSLLVNGNKWAVCKERVFQVASFRKGFVFENDVICKKRELER